MAEGGGYISGVSFLRALILFTRVLPPDLIISPRTSSQDSHTGDWNFSIWILGDIKIQSVVAGWGSESVVVIEDILTHPGKDQNPDLSPRLREINYYEWSLKSLKGSVIALHCGPDPMVGTMVIIGKPKCNRMNWFQGGMGQWWHSTAKAMWTWWP